MLPTLLAPPRRSLLVLLLLAGVMAGSGCTRPYDPATAASIPTAVQETIRDAVEQGHRPGVFVGLVNPQGVHVFHYPSAPAAASTLYGVGSLSKVFTSLCLARLVEQGHLDLDSPVNRYLPEDLRIPPRDGTELTLLHLATHRSGLPKEPAAWDWTRPESPDDIVRFAKDYDYPGPYGSRYVYSNLGMALLGRVMEIRMEQPLAELVTEHVLRPLELSQTTYELDAEQRDRLAAPHRGSEALSADDLQVPEAAYAAGGLYSTSQDLIHLLEVNLALEASEPAVDLPEDLAAALERAGRTHGDTDEADLHMGLGWKVYQGDGVRVVHHGGESAGHQGFLGFDRERRVGVVLLASSRDEDALDQVALHLLTGTVPLPDFSHPKEIDLAREVLESYAGRYRVDAETLVEIGIRDGRLLYTETSGGERIRETTIHASSPVEFYFTEIPATLVFDRPEENGGPAPGLTLFLRGGDSFPARRVR